MRLPHWEEVKISLTKTGVLALSVLLPIIISACAPPETPTPALTPVTLQLQWTHQAQSAGFYAADQLGYYAEEGLAVTFLQGGAEVDNLAAVAEHKALFGVSTAEQMITARAAGMPLRAIAVIFRRSPTVFFSLKDLGITHPQDFAGKEIRAPAVIVPSLHAMTSRVGVSPNQYTEIYDLPSDVQMFASGEVPVWGAYSNGMVIAIQQAGIAINLIFPDDYGVHFYGDTLFASDETISANPQLILSFLRASLKGWTYAVEHPQKASTLVTRYNPQADVALEDLRMSAGLPLVNTGEDHIGWMKAELWAGMEKTLREQKVLTSELDITQVYTTQFLEAIYGQ